MSVHDALPGDIYADRSGKLWRVVMTCAEPTVTVEEVEPAMVWTGIGAFRHGAAMNPEPMIGEAVEAGIDAAGEAVSALPMGQKAWGSKEYMIAETSARAAISAHLEALERAGLVVVPREVIDAARELIVGEQPKQFPPTIEELEAILAGDGGKIRIAPSGEVFVRPTLDRLERAIGSIVQPAPPPQNSDEVNP